MRQTRTIHTAGTTGFVVVVRNTYAIQHTIVVFAGIAGLAVCRLEIYLTAIRPVVVAVRESRQTRVAIRHMHDHQIRFTAIRERIVAVRIVVHTGITVPHMALSRIHTKCRTILDAFEFRSVAIIGTLVFRTNLSRLTGIPAGTAPIVSSQRRLTTIGPVTVAIIVSGCTNLTSGQMINAEVNTIAGCRITAPFFAWIAGIHTMSAITCSCAAIRLTTAAVRSVCIQIRFAAIHPIIIAIAKSGCTYLTGIDMIFGTDAIHRTVIGRALVLFGAGRIALAIGTNAAARLITAATMRVVCIDICFAAVSQIIVAIGITSDTRRTRLHV